ncbi:MAG: GAF domain-containing protein [Gammaproteobacteria bacterium]|nr:GAF domain-containing protein [Gammaproteobacteria bacterium]
MTDDASALLARVERLNEIGIALSAEKDGVRLLEKILRSAKELTHADGGTLYTVTANRTLQFDIVSTDSLGISLGGSTGELASFKPIPLYDENGEPIRNMVVTYAFHANKTINIPDAYDATQYDFSGTRKFDERTHYRTRSLLTIPLKNHEDHIIGVLQLINATDPITREVVAFSSTDQQLAESLASQAAVALTNQRLIADLQKLFESFIQLIATAIDEKSPYTGTHCKRIPVLTMMLAEATHAETEGPLAGFSMNDKDRYELETAAWLHDCGKITSPEYVMDKATKLETIFDRIQLIDTRIELLKRDAEIEYLRAINNQQTNEQVRIAYEQRLQQLNDDRDFLRRANIGGEFMTEADQARVKTIAQYQWTNPEGERVNLLNPEELYNLSIPRGTLTPEERTIINNHMVATIKMLESLPFPQHLARVPEYAGGHHERMDGKGYPKGLTRDQMSVPARVMAVADVFEALSARDRPYKKGKTLSECLSIMRNMVKNQHLDPDIFDVFEKRKVYLDYAKQYMHPDQIDEAHA